MQPPSALTSAASTFRLQQSIHSNSILVLEGQSVKPTEAVWAVLSDSLKSDADENNPST